MTEWRFVVDWPDYQVSDQGQVRSLKCGKCRPLSGRPIPTGYIQVNLSGRDGARLRQYVHALVLEAFVGPRPPGMYARHLNGEPSDNRVENLAWGTQTENNRDIARHGRNHNVNKTHCPQGHPLSGDNLYITPPTSPGNRPKRSCITCRKATRKRLHERNNFEVRAARRWALLNGLECSSRGPLPRAVRQAYAAATEQKAAVA